jgi:hypothetical protein
MQTGDGSGNMGAERLKEYIISYATILIVSIEY